MSPEDQEILVPEQGSEVNAESVADSMEDGVRMGRREVFGKLAVVFGLSLTLVSPTANALSRLTKPDKYKRGDADAKTGRVYEQYKESEPHMRPKEVLTMQTSQEAIFRHYINPGFVNYLERSGYKGVADEALHIAMKHPHFLEYTEKDDGTIVITKRTRMPNDDSYPIKIVIDTIPDDFYIKMETSGHYITQVGSTVLADTMFDGIAWVEGKYDKLYEDLDWPRFINGLIKENAEVFATEAKDTIRRAEEKEDDGKSKKQLQKEAEERRKGILRDIWKSPTKEVKRFIQMNWITMPKRLQKMIDIRSEAYKNESSAKLIDPADKAHENLKKALQGLAGVNTYDQMIEHFIKTGSFHTLLTPDSDYSDIYFIYMGLNESPDEPIIITREGYFLEAIEIEFEEDEYKPDMRKKAKYKDILRDNYRALYPDAPSTDK